YNVDHNMRDFHSSAYAGITTTSGPFRQAAWARLLHAGSEQIELITHRPHVREFCIKTLPGAMDVAACEDGAHVRVRASVKKVLSNNAIIHAHSNARIEGASFMFIAKMREQFGFHNLKKIPILNVRFRSNVEPHVYDWNINNIPFSKNIGTRMIGSNFLIQLFFGSSLS
ncbi:hypothetical protein ACJX0J_011135, partial [Zea mays]